MKRPLLAVGAVLSIAAGGVAGAAHASITPILDSVSADGSDFLYSYHVTLTGDEGIQPGSKLVIFDFAGYVPGTVFSPTADITAAAELLSNTNTATGGVQTPAEFPVDSPTIWNLVFTYTGPAFDTTPGTYPDQTIVGFTAESTFGKTTQIGFSARGINNTDGLTGSAAFNNGAVLGPLAGTLRSGTPEPVSWALMIVGFGAVGGMLRFKKRRTFAFD